MSQYIYMNLHDKLIYWDKLIETKEQTKLSFKNLAKQYGVSDRRLRTEYANAVKVAQWRQFSTLWPIIYENTQNERCSYGVKLYGFLTTNGITTRSDILKAPLEHILSIKGIGPKYRKTIESIREQLGGNT